MHQVHGFSNNAPVDVYELLSSTVTLPKTGMMHPTNSLPKPDKSKVQPFHFLDTTVSKAFKALDGKGISMAQLRNSFSWEYIEKLSRSLKHILNK